MLLPVAGAILALLLAKSSEYGMGREEQYQVGIWKESWY